MDQAIVLAAGASSRMGSPKALLRFGDKRAIERILDVCFEVGIESPIVVLGAHADQIEREANLTRARVMRNQNWERGQTSSLKTGMQALDPRVTWFFLWPVDIPLVSAETVRRLLAPAPASAKLVVPTFEKRRGHPLRIRADGLMRKEILELLDEEPFHKVLRVDPSRVREVPVSENAVLRDFDTPGDLSV